jgi:hypothetical protein
MEPYREIRGSDDWQLSSEVSGTVRKRNCKLSGYFPSIDPSTMIAVVDGVTYPVHGNEPDSQHVFSRLLLVEVEPGSWPV